MACYQVYSLKFLPSFDFLFRFISLVLLFTVVCLIYFSFCDKQVNINWYAIQFTFGYFVFIYWQFDSVCACYQQRTLSNYTDLKRCTPNDDWFCVSDACCCFQPKNQFIFFVLFCWRCLYKRWDWTSHAARAMGFIENAKIWFIMLFMLQFFTHQLASRNCIIFK